MPNLSLKFYPDRILRAECKECHRPLKEILDIGEDMIRIMHEADGLGLAAPQVGLDERIFVLREHKFPGDGLILVNPVIMERSSETNTTKEGCLSIPGIEVRVTRSNHIDIEFESVQEEGLLINRHFIGLQARCVQHEVEHLDGVLIIDHINSNLQRKLILEKYTKKRRQYDRING